MFTIQEIVKDKFWIVNNNNGKVGTLRLTDSGYELFDQTNNTKKVYDSFDKAFRIQDLNREDDITGSTESIQGYSTGVANPIPADHPNLPLFKKTKNGKALYAAGYYLLKFHGMGWQSAFTPKFSTLEKYSYRGPFSTEWECNLELKKHKRHQKT